MMHGNSNIKLSPLFCVYVCVTPGLFSHLLQNLQHAGALSLSHYSNPVRPKLT